MGFDAIWVSPMPTNYENSYHGYHFTDLYTPNPHFGSENDLKELIAACHERDIWVMLDVVCNHVGPVDLSFSEITPFNDSAHYHSKCQIQDFTDQNEVEICRLNNLPDLDQNNSFVRSTLLSWIASLQDEYNFDGYRLSTVPEVHYDFWEEFNTAANRFCLGDVMNEDIDYVSNYQNYIDGVLSYPLYYVMNDVFAKRESMIKLEELIGPSGTYYTKFKDVDALGTFFDNHDNPRFLYQKDNWNSLKNVIVLTLFTQGIPIIYYGTEQGYKGGYNHSNGESLWPNYNTDHELYQFIAFFVNLRKSHAIFNSTQVQRYAASDFYAFSRGNILICLTNTGGKPVRYAITDLPYQVGQMVCNVLSPGDCLTVNNNGINVYLTGEPKVYKPVVQNYFVFFAIMIIVIGIGIIVATCSKF